MPAEPRVQESSPEARVPEPSPEPLVPESPLPERSLEPSVPEPAVGRPPSLLTRALLALIRVYQLVISPLLAPSCRFHPSCSRYTAECLRLHGSLKGSYLGMRRLLRCHPFHPGGYDPPPLPGKR